MREFSRQDCKQLRAEHHSPEIPWLSCELSEAISIHTHTGTLPASSSWLWGGTKLPKERKYLETEGQKKETGNRVIENCLIIYHLSFSDVN